MKKTSVYLLFVLSLVFLSGCVSSPQEDSSSAESTASDSANSAESTASDTSSVASSSDSSMESSSEEELSVFSNILFEGASFVYDATPKSIYVSGAPDFATISYEGNGKVEVGEYEVKASISAPNYVTLELYARLTISSASFSNITFESKSFDYDGESHAIYVEGAPDFAMVSYENNDKIDVGTYKVTARVSAANYETMVITATLTIVGKEITGVSYEDATFTYDGERHYAYVSGSIPDGVSISYKNNYRTESGSQTATATLAGEGYAKLELKATLTIKPMELEDPGDFYNCAYIYDGKAHSIEVKYAPSYATITYKCLNANGTNSFKNPGFYYIEATVKEDSNHVSILRATLTIIEKGSYGVDEGKTPLEIKEGLTWDELHLALGKGNFTMMSYDGFYDVPSLDDPIPEGLLDREFGEEDTSIFATDGKQAYMETHLEDCSHYDYYKEIGEDIVHLDFDTDINSSRIGKFPKAAFGETVCNDYASNAFVALEEGESGEFLPGVNGDDYYSDVGTAYIEDGVFTVLMQHPRSLDGGYRYFYDVYRFYNIGNTKVTIPSSFAPPSDYIEEAATIEDYCLNGVKYGRSIFGNYTNFTYHYTAELYISYARAVFLEKGTYTVLANIYDEPVTAIVFTSSYYSYNTDQKGYTYNLYVDEDGFYQGEYEDYGELGRFDISTFKSRGGTIQYYEQWHNE